MSLSPPEGLRAHSAHGLATSWALFKGVLIQDICVAASWALPHTFVRFYWLDVTEPSLVHSLLSVKKKKSVKKKCRGLLCLKQEEIQYLSEVYENFFHILFL